MAGDDERVDGHDDQWGKDSLPQSPYQPVPPDTRARTGRSPFLLGDYPAPPVARAEARRVVGKE